jgi:hypothetical protein
VNTYSDNLPEPQEVCTRFLYQFNFRRSSFAETLRSLEELEAADRRGVGHKVWETHCLPADGPHHFYKEDLLPHTFHFLFGGACKDEDDGGGSVASQGVSGSACSYMRLTDRFVSKWFDKLDVTLRKGLDVQLRLEPPAQVELFLSDYGAGVLSLAFSPKPARVNCETALAFNYRLSQLRAATESGLRAAAAQAEEGFTLSSLIEEQMLAPLKAFGLERAREQFSVYTVVRFGEEVDLGSEETRRQLAPFLSALAQVEEPTHAGAPPGVVSVPNALLNRRHWAAASVLGSAHIVADQPPPEHPFNSARVPRLLMKYFVPYQVSLLQKMTLHRVMRDASAIVASGDNGRVEELREELLRFAVNGHFTEVSGREAVHRYYRLCQEGLGVRDFLEDARRALSDLEAKHTTKTQTEMAARQIAMLTTQVEMASTQTEMAATQLEIAKSQAQAATRTEEIQNQMVKHLDAVRKLQTKVEWIEIFIIGIYFSELAHGILSYVHAERMPVAEKWESAVIVLGVGILAGFIAWLRLKPERA